MRFIVDVWAEGPMTPERYDAVARDVADKLLVEAGCADHIIWEVTGVSAMRVTPIRTAPLDDEPPAVARLTDRTGG